MYDQNWDLRGFVSLGNLCRDSSELLSRVGGPDHLYGATNIYQANPMDLQRVHKLDELTNGITTICLQNKLLDW